MTLAPGWGAAQTVQGRLLESGSGEPIVRGRVALLDTAFATVVASLTDGEGRFRLIAPGPGSFWVSATGLGYWPKADGLVDLGEGGLLPIDFYLRPRPVAMERLTVRARQEGVMQKLGAAGFFDRMDQGWGHFITPEEIRERRPRDHLELLHGVPGVRLGDHPILGDVLYFRARGARPQSSDPMVPYGYCRPLVYVDGTRRASGTWMNGVETPLEELVEVRDVVGVEILRGTAVPLQWGGSEGGCGVILFWTAEGG